MACWPQPMLKLSEIWHLLAILLPDSSSCPISFQKCCSKTLKKNVASCRETFTPLVEKCKSLGRAIRIGTNHGSLSARILSYYGRHWHITVFSKAELNAYCATCLRFLLKDAVWFSMFWSLSVIVQCAPQVTLREVWSRARLNSQISAATSIIIILSFPWRLPTLLWWSRWDSALGSRYISIWEEPVEFLWINQHADSAQECFHRQCLQTLWQSCFSVIEWSWLCCRLTVF